MNKEDKLHALKVEVWLFLFLGVLWILVGIYLGGLWITLTSILGLILIGFSLRCHLQRRKLRTE